MEDGSIDSYCHCRVDTSGRIVIPLSIRSAKGINNGDELIIGIEEGAIVLRTYEDAMQQLQNAFCDGLDPDVSLVNELRNERRREAELEAGR